MVIYWFESCSPCAAAFDEYKAFSDFANDNTDASILTFTSDSRTIAKKVAAEQGFKFDVISFVRSSGNFHEFNMAFPMYLIVDADGNIKYSKCGGHLEKSKVKTYFHEEIYPRVQELTAAAK